MKYKVKITVIDKKLYPELQQQYCHDPNSGICPCYNVGDEFLFYRDDERDDFWHMGLNTLIKPPAVAAGVVRKAKVDGRCSRMVDLSREVVGGQGDGTAADVFQGDNHLDHMDGAVFLRAKDRAVCASAYVSDAVHSAGDVNAACAAAGGQGAGEPCRKQCCAGKLKECAS